MVESASGFCLRSEHRPLIDSSPEAWGADRYKKSVDAGPKWATLGKKTMLSGPTPDVEV